MDRVQQSVQPKVVAVTLEGWLQLPHTPWFVGLPATTPAGLDAHTRNEVLSERMSRGLRRLAHGEWDRPEGGSHA